MVRHEIPYVAPSPTTETTVMPLNVNDTSFDSVPTVTGVNFYSASSTESPSPAEPPPLQQAPLQNITIYSIDVTELR